MQTFKITTILFFFMSSLTWGQNKSLYKSDNEKLARKFLINALKADSSRTDKSKYVLLLRDTAQVVVIAEQLLFKAYGQKQITDQRPYHLYNLDNYWVMFGTLHFAKGGTFNIIIDAYDCRVIDMDHGK